MHIYDVIDRITQRPEMYGADKGLKNEDLYLHGYVAALDANAVTERYRGRPFSPRAFSEWLFTEFDWSVSQGFAAAIHEKLGPDVDLLFEFSELVERFRDSGSF